MMKIKSVVKTNKDLKKNGYKMIRKLHKMEKKKGAEKAYGASFENTYMFVLYCKGLTELIEMEYGETDEFVFSFKKKCIKFNQKAVSSIIKRKYVRYFIAEFLISWYYICMKENLIHYRTCVCNINYHMVWSVKYRRKILNAEVEAYLQELVQEIAEDKGFTVHLFECGEGDHVHCFVSAPPKLSITAIVKYLKGISGRKLFERFPEIRNQLWKGELWNHSYYVETVGSVSEENIRRYIEHQSKAY